jgi:hypothetical protein
VTPLRLSLMLAALSLWSPGVLAGDAEQQPGQGTPGAASGAGAASSAGGVLANPLATHAIEQLSATRERPLFSPARRPPDPPPAPVVQRIEPTPPPPAPSVVLVGTVTEADGARAIVRSGTATIRLRMGDEIGGWKVTEIETRRLVLSLDDRSAAFTLFGGEPPKPAMMAAPAPNAAPAAKPNGNRPRPRDQARLRDPARTRTLLRESLN